MEQNIENNTRKYRCIICSEDSPELKDGDDLLKWWNEHTCKERGVSETTPKHT